MVLIFFTTKKHPLCHGNLVSYIKKNPRQIYPEINFK